MKIYSFDSRIRHQLKKTYTGNKFVLVLLILGFSAGSLQLFCINLLVTVQKMQ